MGITAEISAMGQSIKISFIVKTHTCQMQPFGGDFSSVFVSHALSDFTPTEGAGHSLEG